MSPQNEIEAYVKQEQAKVRVAPYDDIIFSKSFKGRTRGMWAGALLGVVSGLAIGAAAWPLISTAVGTSVAFSTMTLASATIGAGIGIMAGQLMGATASSAAAAAAERERRDKQEQLREKLLNIPGIEQIAHQAALHPEPVDLASMPSPNTLKEVRERPGGFSEKLSHLFNPKVMVAAALLGAALGGVIGAVGGKWGGMIDLGIEGMTGNAIAGAIMVGTVSSLFGFNLPVVFSSLSDVCGKILSGKIFEPAKAPALAPQMSTPPLAPAHAAEVTTLLPSEQCWVENEIKPGGKSFAAKRFGSYSQMVLDQQAAANPALPSL